jgi:hypothetical protein
MQLEIACDDSWLSNFDWVTIRKQAEGQGDEKLAADSTFRTAKREENCCTWAE